MQNYVVTLLVAKPGVLRDSLATLLMAFPQIVTVTLADDAASALRILETLHPVLIVLGFDLPDVQSWTVLRYVKCRWPHVKCILLADNVQYMHQAQVYGVDEILLQGYPAAKLSAAFERILNA